VGGRGKMEERRRGDKEGEKFWGMKNVLKKKTKKNKK